MSRSDLDIYVENRALHLGDESYAIARIRERLEADGYRCRILDRFNSEDTGRVAFLHLDLTETPSWARNIHSHYPVAVNGRVDSIDRRQYSKALVARDDGYDGPVVAKTVLNARGLPELRYSENRNPATRLAARLHRLADKKYVARKCPPYRFFAAKALVPGRIWKDPVRIVERFIPESIEPPYIKYRCNFLQELTSNARQATDKIFPAANTQSAMEPVDGVPKEVTRIREALHLDFGTIDYFDRDGEIFVVDANKTTQMQAEWLDQYAHLAVFFDRMVERMKALIEAPR